MIAKGHDIPNVTLVGVVGSDAALSFPDFRAAERTFQLLTQVAGRAGRGETPGKVVLQTFYPDHYAIQYAAAHDYRGFYEKEARFRSWMHYPPFNAVSNVVVRSPKLDEALTWSGILGKWFEATRLEGVRVMGPAAAAIVRLKTEYRYHFLLKSASRERMNAALRAMIEHAVAQKIPRTQFGGGCGRAVADVVSDDELPQDDHHDGGDPDGITDHARFTGCLLFLHERSFSPIALGPSASLQRLTKLHQLPEMVGIVVGHQQRFAQQRLTLAARQGRQQRERAVQHQGAHVFERVEHRLHALVPGFILRRGRAWEASNLSARAAICGARRG